LPDLEVALAPVAAAQEAVNAALREHAGHRVQLRVKVGATSLEYVGRVPRRSETRAWPAARRFGDACLYSRPGSSDPANPISPQVHYLMVIEGEWCLLRLRIQDLDPLEIKRLGREVIEVKLKALDSGE
jgi:hypothetical protein